MRIRDWIGLVPVLWVATGASAWTLDEVLQLGLDKGRRPRRLASQLRAAEKIFGRVGGRFRPEFQAAFREGGATSVTASKRLADETRASLSFSEPAANGSPENYRFEIFLPVFRTQALELETARANWESTRLTLSQSLEDFKLEVIRSFFSLLRSHSVVTIRKGAVERWENSLELAKFRAELGVKSKLDFWNTKVNLANSVNDLIGAELNERSNMDRLANSLGLDFEVAEKAEETLAFEAFEKPSTRSFRRRDLAAQGYRLGLARASLKAAQNAAKPDLALTLSSSKTQGQDRDDALALQYNWQFGRRPEWHSLKIAQEALTQAQVDYDQLEADILQEQRAVDRDLEAIARNVQVAQESWELAKLSYEASKLQFENGKITQIELQRSQDNLTNAERTYEGFLIDYRLARFRWIYAYGGTLAP